MYYNRSRSNVKGQGHSVKRRLNAKLLLSFSQSGSLNLNGDVRIFIGISYGQFLCRRSTKWPLTAKND